MLFVVSASLAKAIGAQFRTPSPAATPSEQLLDVSDVFIGAFQFNASAAGGLIHVQLSKANLIRAERDGGMNRSACELPYTVAGSRIPTLNPTLPRNLNTSPSPPDYDYDYDYD